MKSIWTEARMCLLNQAKSSPWFSAEQKPQILIQVWIEIGNLTFVESLKLEKTPKIIEHLTHLWKRSCVETLFEEWVKKNKSHEVIFIDSRLNFVD